MRPKFSLSGSGKDVGRGILASQEWDEDICDFPRSYRSAAMGIDLGGAAGGNEASGSRNDA